MNQKVFFALLLLISSSFTLIAQEVIATNGDYFESGDKSVQFTIGEIATETLQNGDVIITQGFNQPTFTVTSIEKNTLVDIQITVFPNPVTELLVLETSNQTDNLSWKLFDVNGKQLNNGNLREVNQIKFQEYSQGTYILSVIQDDKLVESFRIIKK